MNEHEGLFCKTAVSGKITKFAEREKNKHGLKRNRVGLGKFLTLGLGPELWRGEACRGAQLGLEEETGGGRPRP